MWFTNHGRSFPMRKAKTIRWRKIKRVQLLFGDFPEPATRRQIPFLCHKASGSVRPSLAGLQLSAPEQLTAQGECPSLSNSPVTVTIALTRQSLTLTDKDCKFFRYYRNIDTKNMFIPDCGSAGQGGNGNRNLRASFLWPCKGICAAEPTVYWFFHISFFLSLTSLEIMWSFQVRVIGLGRDKMEETHFRIFVR